MLFNSYIYLLLFLPIAVIVFYLLKRISNHNAYLMAWLAVCSLLFYGWWDERYLLLILASMVINFQLGKLIASYRHHSLVIAAVALNLAALGYFKYTDFVINTLSSVFTLSIEPFNIVLPLAISFYTFQQIAYLVDCYHGLDKDYHFIDYVVFVTFFPQLIAGPIVHHREMMPQFVTLTRTIPWDNIAQGLAMLSIGLFKKVMIADYFAEFANQGFSTSPALSLTQAWVASLSYSLQIYFDFSGYTDMAIGSALLFGIHLPQNFNSPYQASHIADFWRRWHMTLSRFLKEYVYIALGGNRKGALYTYRNLMLTFLLGGLWHGAAWTFVLWGIAHGVALIVHRLWQTLQRPLPKIAAWLITLLFIHLTWIIFRSDSLATIGNFYGAMLGLQGSGWGDINYIQLGQLTFDWQQQQWINLDLSLHGAPSVFPLLLMPAWIVVVYCPNSHALLATFKPTRLYLIVLVLLFGYSLHHLSSYSEFLYFQF